VRRSTGEVRSSRAAAVVAGVLAAAVAVTCAELLAGVLSGGRSLFVAAGGLVINLTPGPVVGFAIATFGHANRLVLLASMSLTVAVAGGLIGLWAARRWWVGAVALSPFALLGIAAGVADPFVPSFAAVLGPLVGAAAGAGTLEGLLRASPQGAPRRPAPLHQGHLRPRRAFLGLAASAAGAALLFAVAGRALQQRAASDAARRAMVLPTPRNPLPPPPPEASLDVAGISPLITPNDRFYRIDTALTVPRINPDTHTIRITGMVARPFELSYAELLDFADTAVDVTLACVSNEVGGTLVGNARWLGVPLAGLLQRAGVQEGATQLVGRAVDGWTAGFPVAAAFDGRPAVVAVGMNGEPLPPKHGFPVRLVVAGLYGYVSDTKWLSEIELTTFDAFDAYWIRRGWAKHGPIKTQSRIDVPRPNSRIPAGVVAIAGVAWAGERGVSAVEVSIDDAWRPAELAAQLAASSWRQWVFRWEAEPGDHVIRVRATDGEGHTQLAENRPPAPDGATGYHTIRLAVV
jgi:DMSO/TMAO reductase YedYZ molybdopterin-dependent catalytic subunit